MRRSLSPERERSRDVEIGVRFALWALSAKKVTWKDIATRFEVSRPTAYRWLRFWKDARGEA